MTATVRPNIPPGATRIAGVDIAVAGDDKQYFEQTLTQQPFARVLRATERETKSLVASAALVTPTPVTPDSAPVAPLAMRLRDDSGMLATVPKPPAKRRQRR